MLAAVLAIAGAYADYREHSVQPANVRLGDGGVVRAWLAAGPFPNAPDENGIVHGLATQWIGSEANANPVEGKYITHLRDAGIPDFWRFSTTGPSGKLDFDGLFNGSRPGVAYAFTSLVADHSSPAVLAVSGAEVVRVILNGRKVFEGGSKGSASVRIATTLDKGINRVLLKVVHSGGGWNAGLRVLAQPGTYEQIQVYREGLHAEPADRRDVRAVRGKRGAIDLQAALAYDDVARRASRWADIFQGELAHPRAFENVLGEAARYVISVQNRDADAISAALRRAANLVTVAFEQSRAQVSAKFLHPEALLRGGAKGEDYVRLDAGRWGFVHANSKPFVVVGVTETMLGDVAFACDPNNPTYDPEHTDAAFAKAADAGVDVVRLNIDAPASLSAEFSAGFNSPEHIKWIDNLVLIAMKHSIKLLLSAGTGPVTNTQRTEPRSMSAPQLRATWSTIIDRWGNSGAILAWEPQGPRAEVAPLVEWIRHYEISRWGRRHLIALVEPSNKALGPKPSAGGAADFAELDLEGASRAFLQLGATDFAPYVVSVDIPADPGAAESTPTNFRQAMAGWAALTIGSAGVLVGIDPREVELDTLLALRTFALGVGWPNLWAHDSRPFSPIAPRRWTATGFGSAKSAVVWAGGNVLGDQVLLQGQCPIRSGRFKVYDCAAHKWLGEGTFKGALTVPSGLKSVAWILESR